MSVYNESDEVEIRDRRLGTIIEYEGSAKDLIEKAAAGHIKCPGRLYNQCSDCAEARGESMSLVVRDTAVVSHAPIGCMTDVSSQNVRIRSTEEQLGEEPVGARYISSNIQEKDTIYGAGKKLRAAILEADRRFKPKAIFVLSSCAAGIIGEDIENIANEMEAQLQYPIVPIYCEGFKSKTWSYGFDAGYHGILRKLVRAPKRRQEDLVNLFTFQDKDVFSKLFAVLGLRINWMQPKNTGLENIAIMSEAACSAHVCETLATYAAAALEEKYGVIEVKTPPPYGVDWTDAWLREIGRLTKRSGLVEKLIKDEHIRIQPELEELRHKLAGKTVYIVSGDTYAHNLANLVKDLGVKVVGLNMLHHDMHPDSQKQAYILGEYTKKQGDMPHVRVCNKQPYQVLKVLQELKPDFLIVRHGGLTSFGTKLGIPTILENDASSSSCYDGVLRMGRRLLQGIATKRFVQNVAEHAELPYTDTWLQQDGSSLQKEKKGNE